MPLSVLALNIPTLESENAIILIYSELLLPKLSSSLSSFPLLAMLFSILAPNILTLLWKHSIKTHLLAAFYPKVEVTSYSVFLSPM